MSITVGTSDIKGAYLGSNSLSKIYVGDKLVRPTVPLSGLLGYRPLQSDLKDASGNGKDASWYGGVGAFFTAGGKTGARVTSSNATVGSLGTQTKSNQHIVTGVSYNGNDISWCGWFYFNTISNYGLRPGFMNNSYVGGTNSDIYGLGLRVAASYKVYFIKNGTSFELYNKPNTGTWYFVSFTISGTSLKFYVNGVLQTTATVASGATNNNYWRIGCGQYDNPARYFGGTDGYVRHCAIYNRELTSSEILDYYNVTS